MIFVLSVSVIYCCLLYTSVELGECCPSAKFMFDMSDYFGVPIEEIFALDKSTESVQRGK